jgi:hypothetical protein
MKYKYKYKYKPINKSLYNNKDLRLAEYYAVSTGKCQKQTIRKCYREEQLYLI